MSLGLARLVGAVYAPFALGFFLSYTIRSVNAVIAGDLTRDIGLTAADLGLLTATYFVAVAAMQLPLGLLLDHYGPRRVQAAMFGFAALGAGLFATGESAADLAVGRALIGLGFAGGLMAALKAFVLWFPRDRLALVNNSMMAFGCVGAIVATVPTAAFSEAFGWRALFWAFAGVTTLAAVIVFAVVPEQTEERRRETFADALRGLRSVYRDPEFWRIMPLCCVVGGSFQALQSLWSGPWLRDIAGLDRAQSAQGLLVMSVALTVGYLGAGVVTDRLIRRGIPVTAVVAVGTVLMTAVQLGLALGWAAAWIPLWIAFGLLGNISALGFTIFGRHFAAETVGRANAAMNTFMFVSAFAAQSAIGWIIHLWPETPEGGYDPAGYRAGIGAFVALQALTFMWFLWRGRARRHAGATKDRPIE